MYDNDHLDEQWLRQTPLPRRRSGAGCGLTLLLVLLLVLAGTVFYPRIRARLTPVQTVQIQRESSVLPDTAPNCSANPRVAAVLHTAMREQTDAVVYGCDADTLTACLGELLDDPELWVRSYRYTVYGGVNAHITVTFDWVYPDDGPARRAQLAQTADGLLAAAPAEDYERALYLYDWLLTHVTYTGRETYDQTAYAAVCEGQAVCGGIADAYVYLLERGGIPARAVTGTSVSSSGASERHAWVAAELNGAVYYFDPTWDLQDEGSAEALPDYLSHTWFALTAARMAVRHTPDAPELWPDSRSNADNYYVRSGYTAAEATVAAAAAAVRSQWEDGRAVLEFRCESPEAYDEMCALLFDRDRLWDVYRALGSRVASSGYQCVDDQQIIRLIPRQ